MTNSQKKVLIKLFQMKLAMLAEEYTRQIGILDKAIHQVQMQYRSLEDQLTAIIKIGDVIPAQKLVVLMIECRQHIDKLQNERHPKVNALKTKYAMNTHDTERLMVEFQVALEFSVTDSPHNLIDNFLIARGISV